MFEELEKRSLSFYQRNRKAICDLVQRNALLKTKVVQLDEFEKGDRKLLNFGHTLGHALEMHYELSHGEAISLGMVFAGRLSARYLKFKNESDLMSVLERYELPVAATFSVDKVIRSMRMDKKRAQDAIDFVLLERIGKAKRKPISLTLLEQLLRQHV